LIVATLLKLGLENRIFQHLTDAMVLTSLNKTAQLLDTELSLIARSRIGCGFAGGVILPALMLLHLATNHTTSAALATVALVLCVIGELLERFLFFSAVAPVKMPGGAMA
jgi:hypothetical protein